MLVLTIHYRQQIPESNESKQPSLSTNKTNKPFISLPVEYEVYVQDWTYQIFFVSKIKYVLQTIKGKGKKKKKKV
jgi:hypothetical protein